MRGSEPQGSRSRRDGTGGTPPTVLARMVRCLGGFGRLASARRWAVVTLIACALMLSLAKQRIEAGGPYPAHFALDARTLTAGAHVIALEPHEMNDELNRHSRETFLVVAARSPQKLGAVQRRAVRGGKLEAAFPGHRVGRSVTRPGIAIYRMPGSVL